jgi:hypothetical protein
MIAKISRLPSSPPDVSYLTSSVAANNNEQAVREEKDLGAIYGAFIGCLVTCVAMPVLVYAPAAVFEYPVASIVTSVLLGVGVATTISALLHFLKKRISREATHASR